MEASNLIAYLAVAALTVAISSALLYVTKIPVVVVISSAVLSAALYAAYARLNMGYWDKFAVIGVLFTMAYACVVSFAFVGLGRFLRWPFFLKTKADARP
jgi:hypothetical protein